MKNILGRSKKLDGLKGENRRSEVRTSLSSADLEPVVSSTKSTHTTESQDSIRDLHPMFAGNTEDEKVPSSSVSFSGDTSGGTSKHHSSFTNDPNLNLNPCILNPTTTAGVSTTTSMFTKDSEFLGKSIFSRSGKSFSTKQSSYFSRGSDKKEQQYPSNEGQMLQVLDIPESSNENRPARDVISDKIHGLHVDISYVLNQYNNSVVNLSTAVINTIDCLKTFVTFVQTNYVGDEHWWYFTTYNNVHLRKLMKIYLNMYDNLLKDEVYIKLKLLLVKNFSDFASTLTKSSRSETSTSKGHRKNASSGGLPTSISKPQNYAIGVNTGETLPNEEVLTNIMNKIANTSLPIKEQNGSFIAPITRGISKELNILCLYFGYPNPTDYHLQLIQRLHELYDEIHFISMQNKIELASASVQLKPEYGNTSILQNNPPQQRYKFKLPFRIPSDVSNPPMSLSVSVENSLRTSGTMGGYIYPMIDLVKQPHLVSYTTSKFAITCGHVCLDNTNNNSNTDYAHVSSPLSVLISLYKKALIRQYQKFTEDGNEYDMAQAESKAAYGAVLNQLSEIFPVKSVKSADGKGQEMKNLPIHRFGQIIWGERTLIKVPKEDDEDDKRLSDLSIIKVNKVLKCDQNFLGDDIAFNEFDPALMFDNLYVRAVIDLDRHASDMDLSQVDSTSSVNINNHGLPVFKYGSTTKYTRGSLNGIKLVYWLDGAIHSSEFVVNSLENNSAFAAGGDSGAWILAKLEDCSTVRESKGLGVVGMLHSYDGEYKQFGLYSPMTEILERLEEVTSIKWGVVGVPQKDTDKNNAVDDDSEDESRNSSYDDSSDEDTSSFEGMEDALPPEID